eukprot:187912-Chlamydomonas_euryale.AAC.1
MCSLRRPCAPAQPSPDETRPVHVLAGSPKRARMAARRGELWSGIHCRAFSINRACAWEACADAVAVWHAIVCTSNT